jgi:hypothetical protein
VNAPPDQFAFHVRTFLPEAEGEELEHRVNLLKARDYAAKLRGQIKTPWGQQHAADAHELAGACLFNPGINNTRLKAAVDYCRALVKAAMLADLLDWEAADGPA